MYSDVVFVPSSIPHHHHNYHHHHHHHYNNTERMEAISHLMTPIDHILLNEHPYVLSPALKFDRVEKLSRDERLRICTLYCDIGWIYQTILEKLRTTKILHLIIHQIRRAYDLGLPF